MRYLFILITLVLTMGSIRAQEFEVVSAVADMSDLQASTNPKLDKKGNACALLKISVPSIEGVTFGKDVVESEYTPGEYLVYIPAKTKSIKVEHPNYVSTKIEFKEYALLIESKVTYKIQLKPQDNVTHVMPLSNKKSQYVTFSVSPAEARVTINRETLTAKDGVITKLLPIGNYSFEVTAADYHQKEGQFVLTKEESNNEIVELKPMFGWIAIDGEEEFHKAVVFIDDKEVGTMPTKSERLKTGTHTLRIEKPFYKTFQDIVIVNDAETTDISVELERLFANVDISVEDEVEIWLNDSLKSVGSWRGILLAGDYLVEARRKNYKTKCQELTVKAGYNPYHISFDSLEAKVGTLAVYLEEDNVSVYLNDQYVGIAPLSIPCIVGNHKLTMRKEGYIDNITTAIVRENGDCYIWGKMLNESECDEAEENELKVISVVSLIPLNDNPMKMFDGNNKTVFNLSPFIGNDNWRDEYFDWEYTCNKLYFTFSRKQNELKSCRIKVSEPFDGKEDLQITISEPSFYTTSLEELLDENGDFLELKNIYISNSRDWQTIPLITPSDGNVYYGTSTIGFAINGSECGNLSISELKFYGDYAIEGLHDYELYREK